MSYRNRNHFIPYVIIERAVDRKESFNLTDAEQAFKM